MGTTEHAALAQYEKLSFYLAKIGSLSTMVRERLRKFQTLALISAIWVGIFCTLHLKAFPWLAVCVTIVAFIPAAVLFSVRSKMADVADLTDQLQVVKSRLSNGSELLRKSGIVFDESNFKFTSHLGLMAIARQLPITIGFLLDVQDQFRDAVNPDKLSSAAKIATEAPLFAIAIVLAVAGSICLAGFTLVTVGAWLLF